MSITWPQRGILGILGFLVAASTAAALVAGLVAGCGGGVGTGGTGSFASGPITGFGSVIVNDIVFDDSGARVEDGDGSLRTRSDLRLGMIVDIDSDAISDGAARATRIRFDGALLGPVDSVSPATRSFSMLGQTVTMDDTTMFDERPIGRLDLLVPGGWVEVHALYDPALQRFRATRVEARLVRPLAYRLRGVIAQLDPVGQTFRIGNATFGYAGAAGVPADLANGQFVRLALRMAAPVPGRYEVAAFSTAVRAADDADGVVVKGLVTSLASRTSFAVDGRPVDAAAARFIDGVPALGLRVEVEGMLRAGVLQAHMVKLRSDDQERDRGFELRGPIESVSAGSPRSFVLRGVTVHLTRPDLRYDPGGTGPADLAVGRRVEVKGVPAPGGSGLEATRIKFD
jgi:hypothetical protein